MPNVQRVFAPAGAALRGWAYYDELMRGDSGLSKPQREMIAVVVSATNRCHYCIVSHGGRNSDGARTGATPGSAQGLTQSSRVEFAQARPRRRSLHRRHAAVPMLASRSSSSTRPGVTSQLRTDARRAGGCRTRVRCRTVEEVCRRRCAGRRRCVKAPRKRGRRGGGVPTPRRAAARVRLQARCARQARHGLATRNLRPTRRTRASASRPRARRRRGRAGSACSRSGRRGPRRGTRAPARRPRPGRRR